MTTIIKDTKRTAREIANSQGDRARVSQPHAGSVTLCARFVITLLLMVLGVSGMWGQTDYSGTYYIGSKDYKAATPTSNYYLCPTEGWCYYKATDDFSGEDTGMPFLTTHTCRGDDSYDTKKAVWVVEKHPTQNYYYIRHALDNKYLVSNGTIRTTDNPDRMRVHLEAVEPENLDDKELFAIEAYSTYLTISPKGVVGGAADRRYLVVNGGNNNSLQGASGKTGGPTGYTNTTGIIGVYTQSDANAPFYLEKATIDPPVITDNEDGTLTITAETGATIYYTIDGSTPTTTTPTSGITSVIVNTLTESSEVVKAIAKSSSDDFPTIVTTYRLPQCAKPVVTVSSGTVTITCDTAGATIRYTTDESEATLTSPQYGGPFALGDASVIRAIASKIGYAKSEETYYIDLVTVTSSDEIDNMRGSYRLADGFTSSASIGTAEDPFRGVIDGSYVTLSNLNHPLVGYADGATIKNVILKDVSIIGGTDAGAICNEATGATKIYNCGVLSGSVSGSGNVGGLVGHIAASSSVRVVNCYNYATVSGGSTMAGIVGKNDGEVGNVRIALCMMYGDMPDGTSPVYAGNHNSNASDFTEYNYWRSRANIDYSEYNDQLAIDKDEYLTRFPFYRHILNSHRELAAYFLFGTTGQTVSDITAAQVSEIGHWALKKDVAPYPIIEAWQTGTKRVLDAPATNMVNDENLGTSLSVSVKIGSKSYSASLPITAMDEANYDYTYGKVVLPFANEFEVNTDYSKVCTGWKITGITGGTPGTFSNYDVSDRDCTAKDLYSTTGFIFAQGGNYVVPYGVTEIEITANFATAYYLSDEAYEIAYSGDNTGSSTGYIGRTGLGGNMPDSYHGQTVYHTLAAALGAMNASGSTHNQAVVLVGNYHQDSEVLSSLTSKGYTMMSIDADNNQEPDYAFYCNNTQDRPAIPPTRFDFVALIPVGMSSRVNNSTFYPVIPIWKPRGWFELTETSLSTMEQFELDSGNFNTSSGDTRNYRCIINGGYFTQMVRSRATDCSKVKYYQIGGNAYVKEFYPGSHSNANKTTTLVPINVTGGEIEQCFMTGYGKGTATGSDIYFWCAGGKIGKFLGAYMENPKTVGVNMTAKIDHAKIGRFFGGGTSPKAQITGNIDVTINNSTVDFYCGGPEFGDMSSGKTVTTRATGTTFGEYYGAGFGGTAITYTNDEDNTTQGLGSASEPKVTYPSSFFTDHYLSSAADKGRLHYKSDYGIGSCYKFEFLFNSRGHGSVARFYTGYAKFSLATTGSVTNVLNGCTITNDFYGAGCQGKVAGTVTSTLTGCTIHGSAYGGGFKAESNEVAVYPETVPAMSVYTRETGIFSDFGTEDPDTYIWEQGTDSKKNTADEEEKKLYTGTDITMTDLGNVTGAISLTINGGSVGGNVFGGGNESLSKSDTSVHLHGGVVVQQSVFGGGNKANVEGSSNVRIE